MTRRLCAASLLSCALFLHASFSPGQTFGLVDRFRAAGEPRGHLLRASDGNIYGTTRWGGASGVGTIFRLDPDGAVVTLHSFGFADGAEPLAGLIEATDGPLYGTTSRGGSSDLGTVFRMDLAGHLVRLHSFTGGDGASPYAELLEGSDGNFYGTTFRGGTADTGTVFRMDTTGTVTSLHSFTGATGSAPSAPLIEANGALYGTAQGGGTGGLGTVFRVDPGGMVTVLLSFSGSDGATPYAGLLLGSDGNFYGTTSGVNSGAGTAFRMDFSGSITTIHTFSNAFEGVSPRAPLIEGSDGNFYGTTRLSEVVPPFTAGGTAFRLTTGGAFTMLKRLDGFLESGLIEASPGRFFGTTAAAGTPGGSVYELDSAGTLIVRHRFFGIDGAAPTSAPIQASDGMLYGTTTAGGAYGKGTVFRMEAPGRAVTLHSFGESPAAGVAPYSGILQADDGFFYGTTTFGGNQAAGTTYRMDSCGEVETLQSFDGADYRYPRSLFQGSDGNLYGTTQSGGSGNEGVFFRMDTSGNLTKLHDFDPVEGTAGGIVSEGSDGAFYGTGGGGPGFYGTAFRIDDQGTVTTLHAFSFDDGGDPDAPLLEADDGLLYGTTASGGANGLGTIFRVDAMGEGFETLHDFDGTDGETPVAPLIQADDGDFYGTTAGWASGTAGTVFRMDQDANVTTLHSFLGSDGYSPEAGLLQAADGSLYGTTRYSGPAAFEGQGVIFRLTSSSLAVNAVMPTSGPASGGAVALFGGGILDGATFTVGAAAGTDTAVLDPTFLYGTAPALLPGTLNDVSVQSPPAGTRGLAATLPGAFFADFLDVPQIDNFHASVEAIFRAGITAGCGGGNYCRNGAVTRAQMAVFLLKASHGAAFVPPPCTGTFTDVDCPSLFADWIEQLANEGITAGCGAGLYCPDESVTRAQMAVFLIKARDGRVLCSTASDRDLRRRAAGRPGRAVRRASSPAARSRPAVRLPHACIAPTSPNTRGQMAVFLAKTFGCGSAAP